MSAWEALLAGPVMNLLISVTLVIVLIGWLAVGPQGTSAYRNITTFLWAGAWLNIVLGLFNLLPVPPLDGSSILSGLSYRCYQFFQQPQAQMFGMFIVLAILITGCGSVVFAGAGAVAGLAVNLPGALLGSPSVFDVVYG